MFVSIFLLTVNQLFKNKAASTALCCCYELASACCACLKAARKFFNCIQAAKQSGIVGKEEGGGMYFEVLCAKDNRKSLMRAEECCNCGGSGCYAENETMFDKSEITTRYRDGVGFVYTSFGNME